MTRFAASAGKLTGQIRAEYLRHLVSAGEITPQQARQPRTTSFDASPDPSDPLFFWQLYSVLGEARIRSFITSFYERVLRDTEAPWFSRAFFELGDLSYHVEGQLRFWQDVFAGGRRYEPGVRGLEAKHKLVREIMTDQGARRWMHHMRGCIEVYRQDWTGLDPRIVQCVQDFLTFFMEQYGFSFEFNVVEWVHRFFAAPAPAKL